MNIEKISPDKLRVTLDSAELDRYNLDYISISAQSPATKRMLKDILAKALTLEGFSAKGSQLLVEVVPGKDKGCILYLTKAAMVPEQEDIHTVAQKEKSILLSCALLEDILDAVNRFADFPEILLKKSALYYLRDQYFLLFSPVWLGMDKNRFRSLLAQLSEYGKITETDAITEAMLLEHGKAIKEEHAVEQIMLYFH